MDVALRSVISVNVAELPRAFCTESHTAVAGSAGSATPPVRWEVGRRLWAGVGGAGHMQALPHWWLRGM